MCEHTPKVARGMCRRCYSREYYRNNTEYRERLKEQKRLRYASDPEPQRRWNKDYYAANRERELERRKAWTAANRERQRQYNDQWRRANLDRAVAARQRRRAREVSAPGVFTASDWAELLEEFDNRCAYCQVQSDRLVIEHMTPLSRGGENAKRNIVPSCRTCNSRKGTRTIFEYLSTQKGPTQP